ncbi:hypothetical protein AKJ56_01815 [candidate division MSBL1 archaeon SCGC-AAA382N08]|uniref:Uncharacterized protein n=1 Tax=candidate division MSBL1 archaeon SCGC-AAA382N08 TaxID=1698285 RepID=A0A133VNV9_9EURY|nr:hypothetical protein AKJ56_01815 [candidate division MSBL1 archaeon SCGC-AAA382N08]
MALKADIVSGTNRSFKFSFQNMTDIRAYDTEYGVYVKPNQADSWTVVDPSSSVDINTGSMTVSKSSDSPSGNVPSGGTGVTLAKFTADAVGEDVKVTAMTVEDAGDGSDLDNVKVYLDGVQKGSTQDFSGASASYSFGNTFIIDDAEDSVIKIVGDIKSGGSDIGAGTSIKAKISSWTAKGRTSLASVSPGTVSGYSLDVSSGGLSVSKSSAQPNWDSTTPTGVVGASDVKVSSFAISAGSGEGCDISSIKMSDNGAFSDLQNLKLYKGTKESGTKLGNTQSTVASGTSYTFYPSPYVSLDASEQFTLNVYADILSSATTAGPSQRNVKVKSLSATGKTTNNSLSSSDTPVTGQQLYIASEGNLAISQDSGTPNSDILLTGSSDNVFSSIEFDASTSSEDMKVTSLVIGSTLNSAPTSTITNLTIGGDVPSNSVGALSSDGTYTFDISSNPWVIEAGAKETLDISADINTWQNATSVSGVNLSLATTTYKGAVSGNSTTVAPQKSGNNMEIRKTEVEFALNSDGTLDNTTPKENARVMYFDVTNKSVDYDATLGTATFSVSVALGDADATASEPIAAGVYDNSDDTLVNATSAVYGAADNGLSNSTTTTFALSDETIPAGATKTYYIKTDTGDSSTASNGTSWVYEFTSATDVAWSDGIKSGISSSLINSFPVSQTINF